MGRRLEEILYDKAASMEEYRDSNSLRGKSSISYGIFADDILPRSMS